MRTPTLLLLATLATIVPVCLAGVRVGRDSPAGLEIATTQVPPSSGARALAVLRGWDRRRAAAWEAGDPAALSALYLPRSRTGTRDVRDLRRWVGRGLRVVGLRQQVTSLRVVRRTPRRLVVVVTDRTVDGIAVGRGRRTAVPTSAWTVHRVVLRRPGRRWRVAEARAQPAR